MAETLHRRHTQLVMGVTKQRPRSKFGNVPDYFSHMFFFFCLLDSHRFLLTDLPFMALISNAQSMPVGPLPLSLPVPSILPTLLPSFSLLLSFLPFPSSFLPSFLPSILLSTNVC